MRALPLLLLVGCTVPPSEPPEPKVTVDFDNPLTCLGCHTAVVEEWGQSMHSNSHHDKDPIFGSMRALRMKKQGDQVAEKCAKCHYPRSPTAFDSAAAKQGVSCATCHAAEHVDLGKGIGSDTLTFSPHTLRGARDVAQGVSIAHGTGPAAAHLADGTTICLACHDKTKTPSGAAACTTGPEHSELSEGQTCTSCHMPVVPGPNGTASKRDDHRSHAFLGPHRAWYQQDNSYLATAADLTVSLEGTTASVTITNQAGHALPTGFPGRLMILMVEGRDAEGAVVWKNIESNPMTDSPKSVFNKVYVDADGKPTPAAFAQELKRDNRLKAGETRTLTYEVPPSVTAVDAKLVMRLLPPKLATKLGLEGKQEAEPRLVKKASTQPPK